MSDQERELPEALQPEPEAPVEAEKQYPGSLTRYRHLRKTRENAEKTAMGPSELAALTIAEELAGLAYLLDGIRYSARQK